MKNNITPKILGVIFKNKTNKISKTQITKLKNTITIKKIIPTKTTSITLPFKY